MRISDWSADVCAADLITYFNEVTWPSIGSFAPTFDGSNVQVLKGPQGTLFGRNTTGGAVLVYSALPPYDLEGYAEVEVGNYNKREFQGALNIPIIDDVLAIRLAADIDRRKGFNKNRSEEHQSETQSLMHISYDV